MNLPAVTHGTFVIERSYDAARERVFAAFADPEKKRRWFADGRGMEVVEFTTDFREGGIDRTCSRFGPSSPFPGLTMTNESRYLDIVPGGRIIMAYTMAIGDRRISVSLATIEFFSQGSGTRLVFTDQGAYFEGSDGVQMREGGWAKLLDSMGQALAA